MDDREIIDLFLARSEQAIAETRKKYGGYCRTIAFRILRDDQDSDECLNDTWLAAWNAIPPKRPAVLSTFLGRLTRNLALNRRKLDRAKKRGGGEVAAALEELQECVAAPGGIEADVDALVLSETLSRFIGTLSQERARFFVQRYWYLCSVQEIAHDCGVSVGKVKTTLHRTRNDLREFLRKEGFEP